MLAFEEMDYDPCINLICDVEQRWYPWLVTIQFEYWKAAMQVSSWGAGDILQRQCSDFWNSLD